MSSEGEGREGEWNGRARLRRSSDLIGPVPASRLRRSRSQSRSRAPTPPGIKTTATRANNSIETSQRRTNLESHKPASYKRYSLPAGAHLEPVPAIPARFLEIGRPVSPKLLTQETHPSTTTAPPPPPPRPSTSGGDTTKSSRARSFTHALHTLTSPSKNALKPTQDSRAATDRRNARAAFDAALRKSQVHKGTLAQLEGSSTDANMSWLARARNEDLFLEMANERAGTQPGGRPPSRGGERSSSRLSFSSKRRSLPPDTQLPTSVDRRPRSSGHIFANRPPSRVGTRPVTLQDHVEQYRSTPSHVGLPTTADEATSLSGRSRSGRQQLYSNSFDHASPMSPTSLAERVRASELPNLSRARPSFTATPPQSRDSRAGPNVGKLQDSFSDSLVDGSEPKQSQQDSASADSETADTVWDELDDLKSRIKKLELTGKLPPTSGAAVSNESTETRPRTATTAPTTIDSSPKHEKVEKAEDKVEPEIVQPPPTLEYTVGGPATANIHPLLHAALAKAKPLLNATLYRTLEATAADALQLAALTGSAGPQGTAFSAASIINGVAVADRHVRRKADTMCRNLTDLCLALCDGKIDTAASSSSLNASPAALDIPPIRSSRSSLGGPDTRLTSRPMSRLEARRTSILGSGATTLSSSPRNDSIDDISASEQEGPPSLHSRPPPLRRVSRASSRLQVQRSPRWDDGGTSGDEDPTLRPASRAFTDAGRRPLIGPRDYNTPSQRSPSLRESLVSRARAGEQQQQLSRVSSLNSESSRRRFLDHSTPPVLEEEIVRGTPEVYVSPVPTSHQQQQTKRRVTTYGQYGSGGRRATEGLPNRATSLTQRRHIVVE